jgi:hypothetical protein
MCSLVPAYSRSALGFRTGFILAMGVCCEKQAGREGTLPMINKMSLRLCLLVLALPGGAWCGPLIITNPITISAGGGCGFGPEATGCSIQGSGTNGTDSIFFDFNTLADIFGLSGFRSSISVGGTSPGDFGYGGYAVIDNVTNYDNNAQQAEFSFNSSTDSGFLTIQEGPFGAVLASAPVIGYGVTIYSDFTSYFPDGFLAEEDLEFGISATPEPGGIVLVGFGMLALIAGRAYVWRAKMHAEPVLRDLAWWDRRFRLSWGVREKCG